MEHSDYRTFIEPIRHRMVDSIWRIVRDADDTDDVLQNVLLKIARQAGSLCRHPNPTALILRMCVNCAIDWRRERTSRTSHMDSDCVVEALRTAAPSPAEKLLLQERQARVMAAIGQLPRRQAEALLLLGVEGFSAAEAAEAMGCRQSTVRVLVLKARKRLKAALADDHISLFPQALKEA